MIPAENYVVQCDYPIVNAAMGDDVLYGNRLNYVWVSLSGYVVRDYRSASVDSLKNKEPVDFNGLAFVVPGDNLTYPHLPNGIRLMEPISWHDATHCLLIDKGMRLEPIEGE